MLRWLGERHGDGEAAQGAARIEEAVQRGFRGGSKTPDIGTTTDELGKAIVEVL